MAKSSKAGTKKSAVSSSASRTRKLTKAQQRSKDRKTAAKREPLPSSFRLTSQAFKILRTYWKPLLGIIIVYMLLNIIFASGLSNLGGQVDNIKANLDTTGQGSAPLKNALSGFSNLIATSGTSGSSTGSILQSMLIVLVSLVIIWSLRQLLAGKAIGIKEAYYSSATPLVPFMLIFGLIFIQLIPLIFGSTAASTILGTIFINGGAGLVIIFSLIFIGLLGWTIYMLSSSVFALYIVTLPGMMPLKAWRSAKNLVHFRRWSLIRKMLFLPLIIIIMMGLLIIPLIMYATFLVAPVFYVLTALTILFVHTYLYNLYRNLLA